VESAQEQQHSTDDKNWQNAGLELLVDLAKKREIDPWDVDLVELIDKFLRQIPEDNIQKAAEIIFFVSVILRLKSEDMHQKEEEEEIFHDDLIDFEELGLEEENISEEDNSISIDKLDKFLIHNRKTFKQARQRKVTLDDLIAVFEQAKTPKAKKKKRLQLHMELEELDGEIDDSNNVLELAHEEDLENKIKVLGEHILKILQLHKKTPLSQLEEVLKSRIDTFLSALFLCHTGKMKLLQEDFYGEMHIERLL